MPVLFHKGLYRPAAAPSSGLPFGVRSAGHYKIAPPFTSLVKTMDCLQLFWCVRGAGIIEFERRPRTLKKNQIAMYYPNMQHCWRSDRKSWEFYFFTLDGALSASFPSNFGLLANIYNAGPAPVALFEKLFPLLRHPSKRAELQACAVAFTILTRAAMSQTDRADALAKNAVAQIHREFASPALNIKTLAADIGIQRAVLSARFKAAMGTAPGEYLKRLRLQHALMLLTRTRLPITAIASRSGYADTHYFSRDIRRITGHPPIEFRRRNKTEP